VAVLLPQLHHLPLILLLLSLLLRLLLGIDPGGATIRTLLGSADVEGASDRCFSGQAEAAVYPPVVPLATRASEVRGARRATDRKLSGSEAVEGRKSIQ